MLFARTARGAHVVALAHTPSRRAVIKLTSRPTEALALARLRDDSRAPRLLFASPGVLIMSVVQGVALPPRPPSVLRSPGLLHDIGVAFAWLHRHRAAGLPAVGGGATAITALSAARAAWRRCRPALRTRDAAHVSRALTAAHAHLHHERFSLACDARVLLHGDPCRTNLRRTASGIAFIDFEQAGVGDPTIDLHRLTSSWGLSRAAELAMVSAWAEARRDPHGATRYALAAPVMPLCYALLGTDSWLAGGASEARRAIVQALWARALPQLPVQFVAQPARRKHP